MIMKPEEIEMVRNTDKRLEKEIGEMQRREVHVKQVAMGRELYRLFIKYSISKKIEAVANLAGDNLVPIIYTEMIKRISANLTLTSKNILFERVGGRRYPIQIDLNSDSPLSVRLIC